MNHDIIVVITQNHTTIFTWHQSQNLIWFSIHQQTHLINSSAADQHRPLRLPHHTRIFTVVVGSSNTVGSYQGCETQPEKPTWDLISKPNCKATKITPSSRLASYCQGWPWTVANPYHRSSTLMGHWLSTLVASPTIRCKHILMGSKNWTTWWHTLSWHMIHT